MPNKLQFYKQIYKIVKKKKKNCPPQKNLHNFVLFDKSRVRFDRYFTKGTQILHN